jgi:hypothetical protein
MLTDVPERKLYTYFTFKNVPHVTEEYFYFRDEGCSPHITPSQKFKSLWELAEAHEPPNIRVVSAAVAYSKQVPSKLPRKAEEVEAARQTFDLTGYLP